MIRTDLGGVKILVTRRYEDSRELTSEIRRRGGDVSCLPMIEVAGPGDRESLAASRKKIGDFDWLVLTSRHSARSFLEGLSRPGRNRVAVVGDSTAAEVERWGWPVHLKGNGKGATALARALEEAGEFEGRTFLYPCSNLARTDFATAAMDAGASGVLAVEAYRVVRPIFGTSDPDPLAHDIAVFASPSAVDHMAQLLGERGSSLEQIHSVSIGPTTTAALQERGAAGVWEARSTDPEGLLAAISEAWREIKEGRNGK